MKRLVPVVCLVLALALGNAILAEGTDVRTVSGAATAVNVGGRSVTVEVTKSVDAPKAGAGQKLEFSIDDQTVITKDGKPIELQDITVGDRLTVNYKESGGSQVALSIGVSTQAAS